MSIGVPSMEMQAAEPEQSSHRFLRAAKMAGKLAAWASLSVAGGAAAVMLTPTEVQFGPHETEVNMTLDSTLTLDFGPAGSIKKPLGHPVGARVEVGSVYIEEGATVEDVTNTYLGDTLRLLGDADQDIERGKQAILERFGAWTLFTAIGSFALYRYRGTAGNKLRQAVQSLDPRAGLALQALALGALAPVMPPAPPAPIEASPIFDGTPLEGASVQGPLLELVIPGILDYLEENEQFYDEVSQNLELAVERTYFPQDTEDTVTFLFYTDNHCNLGMGRVIGRAVDRLDIDYVYSGGDETFSGSSFEELCIQTMARYVDGVIIAPGNHDSDITEEQMRRHGMQVLNGEVMMRNDLSDLGDSDPRRSSFNQPIEQAGDETIAELGQRMAETACAEEEGVDTLMVHDKNAVRPALEAGCAGIGLAGHSHERSLEFIATPGGRVVPLLTGDSSGGAERNIINFGPLQTPAELYVIRYNTSTNTALSLRPIVIGTDASVIVEKPTYLINQQPTGDQG